eukprot:6314459-Amphidinium_carterae.1
MLMGEVAKDARRKTDMHLACYADADLSGGPARTSRFATGYWLEFVADGRTFPIAWCSKKQTATSASTAEAELVSMATAVKESAIPAQI